MIISPDVSPFCSIDQRSQFIWTNAMLSQLQAATMESRSDLSPPARPAAESPSMNLLFMNRTGPLRTNLAGSSDCDNWFQNCEVITAQTKWLSQNESPHILPIFRCLFNSSGTALQNKQTNKHKQLPAKSDAASKC